ncbi:MAG: type IV pilin protein [Pseudomonadota bacterium]
MTRPYRKATHSGRLKAKEQGFTLIELMMVVVILGILTAIALPQFTDYKMKSRRSEATSTLMQIAAQQEQFFMDNRSYTGNFTQLGYTAAGSVTTDNGYYSITISAAPVYSYTLTATPQGAQAGDTDCASFTLTNEGTKGALDSSNNTATGACW